ncbi:MAG: isopentenyl phosphate kinase [Thermoplasmatota archaeon]
MSVILVKLGGSVITDKARYRTARPDHIRRLAAEVAAGIRNMEKGLGGATANASRGGGAGPSLYIVHGAGSFGHVVAKEFHLSNGASSQEATRAAALVHRDVRALNEMVLEALYAAGLAPFSVPAYVIARLRDGELVHLDLSTYMVGPVGSVPVTFGDIVPDDRRGVGILSGDDILAEVGLALRHAGEAVDVIFALEADGVLDGSGRVVEQLGPTERIEPSPALTVAGATLAAGVDVTGGIRKKVAAARRLAAAGARVRFVSGTAPGRVEEAISGKRVLGTEILA